MASKIKDIPRKFLSRHFIIRNTSNVIGKIQEKVSEKTDLDINNIYVKHVELYIHLDKLIWLSLAGVAGIVLAVYSALISIAISEKLGQHFAIISLFPLLFLAMVVNRYMNTLEKFNRGKDFICSLLSEIERDSGLLRRQISIPTENRSHLSFFIRRETSFAKKEHKKRMFVKTSLLLSILYVFIVCCIIACMSVMSLKFLFSVNCIMVFQVWKDGVAI